MKKIILLVVATIALALSPSALAGEKIKVEVRTIAFLGIGTNSVPLTEISILLNKVEYIADAETPDTLKRVRVWKGPDSVAYDLTAIGIDYDQAYSNTPADDKKLSKAAAAKLWATYLEKFEVVRKTISVEVRLN